MLNLASDAPLCFLPEIIQMCPIARPPLGTDVSAVSCRLGPVTVTCSSLSAIFRNSPNLITYFKFSNFSKKLCAYSLALNPRGRQAEDREGTLATRFSGPVCFRGDGGPGLGVGSRFAEFLRSVEWKGMYPPTQSQQGMSNISQKAMCQRGSGGRTK